MNRSSHRRVGAAALAAATLVGIAACSPPSKTSADSGGSGGTADKAGTATSAAALGGMDALVAAAKKEGTLNVIALPPDWANYGEVIKAFQAKYGIKVDIAAARRLQRGRDHRGQEPQGPVRARRTSSTSARRSRPPTRACSRRTRSATFGEIPTKLKDAERHLGQRLRRLHVASATTPSCPAVTTVADLLKPAVQGQGGPQRRPDQGRRRLQRRRDGGDRATAAPPTTSARAWTSSSSSRTPATSCRSTRRRPRSSPARRRSSSTGTTSTSRRAPSSRARWTGRRSSRRTPRSAATTSRRSTRTPRTRRPPACGRSSCTPTRARTSGSRAARGRCAPTPWSRRARSTRRAHAALPQVGGHARPAHRRRRPTRRPTYLKVNWAKSHWLSSSTARQPRRSGARPVDVRVGRPARCWGCCRSSATSPIFLVIPTLVVVVGAFLDGGNRPTLGNVSALDPAAGRSRPSSTPSILSAVTAVLGAVFGALLAYAVATGRPGGLLRRVDDGRLRRAGPVRRRHAGVRLHRHRRPQRAS